MPCQKPLCLPLHKDHLFHKISWYILIENTLVPPAPLAPSSMHYNSTVSTPPPAWSWHQNFTNTLPSAPPTSPLIQHNPVVPATQPPKSRLPKITLAKFRGEVTQFWSFWDSFERTVHSNPGLMKVNKLKYFVSLLDCQFQAVFILS